MLGAGRHGRVDADGGHGDASSLWQAEDNGGGGAVWRPRRPGQGVKTIKEQLLQLIQDQEPGRVVGDGMVVDGAPAHAPAAAAGTAPGAKPSTASEGLLARLAASGGAFTADDITFSVRTMLDENAHALPSSLAALKSIVKEIVVVREGLSRSEPTPDKLHRTFGFDSQTRGSIVWHYSETGSGVVVQKPK